MGANTTITGPIQGGTHGWAFGVSGDDLPDGYVEEEYFIEGEATTYRHAAGTDRSVDGRWSAEPAAAVPYKTRFIVQRPARAEDFNGTVVVCWNNVSGGVDAMGPMIPEIYASGCVFVGAAVQRNGLEGYAWAPQFGLRLWDRERYGSLSIESDNLSNDIFTQIGRAVSAKRSRTPMDPMSGFEVKQLVGYGASQSGASLATYVNAVQPLAGVYDAFILEVYFGTGMGLWTDLATEKPANAFESVDDLGATLENMPLGTHQVRDDLGIPILVLNSESEAPLYYPVRQPDTDTFRLWEVAGAAHVGAFGGMPTWFERDLGMAGFPIPMGDDSSPSAVPLEPVRSAAVHHMIRWIDGVTPPSFPRIEVSGDPPAVIRDADGNAEGGIRLPELRVPTGSNSGAARDGKRDLLGTTTPFSPEQLRERYPDHETYVSAVEDAARACADAGILLPRDVDTYVLAAKSAAIP